MRGARAVLRLCAVVAAAAAAGACGGGRPASPSPAPMTEMSPSRTDSFRVAMPQLGGRERTVHVHLPPGYEGGTRRYPVLYLQDGQQVFRPGWFGDWRVDETVDSLVRAGRTPGVIVVGVESGERRWDEYGPWANREIRRWVDSSWARPVEGGEGDRYVAFLAETLKPLIDARYRTRPEREHTLVGGSSMGGLISLHAGLTRPDVFGRVMAMSTAAWFAEEGGPWLSGNRLVREIRSRPAPAGVRFYLDVGTRERSKESDPGVRDADGALVTYERAYVEGSRAAADALRAAGVPADDLLHVIDDEAPHNEAAWARRFPDALLWLLR